jgi:hypothetical protein
MPYKAFEQFDYFNIGSVRYENERRLKADSTTDYEVRTITYVTGWLEVDAASIDDSFTVAPTDPQFHVGNSQTGQPQLIQFIGTFKTDTESSDFDGEKATVTVSWRRDSAWTDDV